MSRAEAIPPPAGSWARADVEAWEAEMQARRICADRRDWPADWESCDLADYWYGSYAATWGLPGSRRPTPAIPPGTAPPAVPPPSEPITAPPKPGPKGRSS